MNDIKVPPFTDGQKQLIEMMEKLAEKRGGKICDVDDDITDIKELLNDTIKRIEEPMTNEEWFCQLTTEEKAMAIVLCCPYEINWFGENFEKRMEQRIKNLSQSAQGYGLGIQKIKEWLKQPHTVKE